MDCWACFWRIFFTVNSYRRARPTVSGTIPWASSPGLSEKAGWTRAVWTSKQAFLHIPTLRSYLDFAQWWTVTWKLKLTISSATLLWSACFNHSSRKAARAKKDERKIRGHPLGKHLIWVTHQLFPTKTKRIWLENFMCPHPGRDWQLKNNTDFKKISLC